MKLFAYQNKKAKDYFEGWYFRFTTNNTNYAVIFAITKNQKDPHAFIQLFKDSMKECEYLRFDTNEFQYDSELSRVSIGKNHLSTTDVKIDENSLKLELDFVDKKTLYDIASKKSAMGYLSNVPLQCFQEIIYLDGSAKGTLNGESIEGKIYIEKTYGSRFPVQWIWLQSNHSNKGSQISFSVGLIPLLGVLTKGFLCVLNTGDEFYHFYTGNRSRVDIKKDRLIIKKGKLTLIIIPSKSKTIKLAGPAKKAEMIVEVYETLNTKATVKLFKEETLLFEDTYTNVGYENMW